VLELAPLPSASGCARLHATHLLHEWGLRHRIEDVALIVSELVTNACDASVVMPTRPPVALRLLASENSLVVEVWDHSPLELDPGQPDAGAECGRGLTVVAALSDQWGCHRTSRHHKVVWARLAL
jgi:anti-sigma regulatory factor (Ser/Thr protein kinase)